MLDKIINILAITAIIAIIIGLFIAIWFGYIGLKITATGTVVFAAAWIINTWARAEKKTKEGKND
jgi:hypothetical protein